MWAVEYQPTKGAPWISLGLETTTSEAAWEYLVMVRKTTSLDYYAAQVYRLADPLP